MNIDVRSKNVELTPTIHQHVRRRLGFALGARADLIRLVEVMLTDVNGPKGGRDQKCRLLIRLDGLPDVITEDTQHDLRTAIDRAAAKASHTLARKLSKLKAHHHLGSGGKRDVA